MKRVQKVVFILLGIGLMTACSVLFLAVVNLGITIHEPALGKPIGRLDIHDEDQAIIAKLRTAPWQGLRFIPAQREWRFYAVAGEGRKIDMILPFDLVKVSFLQANGDLTYTWAAVGVTIPGKGYFASASSPVQQGDLVELAVGGNYVTGYGVEWDQCDTEYCHLAQMIDATLILDDKGTGLTNGFIRYGWEPPSYPMYGFLCWQIRPYNDKRVAQDNR